MRMKTTLLLIAAVIVGCTSPSEPRTFIRIIANCNASVTFDGVQRMLPFAEYVTYESRGDVHVVVTAQNKIILDTVVVGTADFNVACPY